MLATPSDDLGDLGLGRIRVARRHGEVGPEDDVVARHARVAIGVVEPVDACDLLVPAPQVDEAAPLESLARLRAVPAGVHAHRPADRSRDTHCPFEPGQPGVG